MLLGTGNVQLTMAQELVISAAIIVTTPQLISIDDVSSTIMIFKDTNVHISGLVENMSYFLVSDTKSKYIFWRGNIELICKKYKIPLLGKIPFEITIRENCDQAKVSVSLANDEIKDYYKGITANLFKSL